MKKLITALFILSISLGVSAESSNGLSNLILKNDLLENHKTEQHSVRFRPYGKHHMKVQRFNKKLKNPNPCESKAIKPEFSNNFRPR